MCQTFVAFSDKLNIESTLVAFDTKVKYVVPNHLTFFNQKRFQETVTNENCKMENENKKVLIMVCEKHICVYLYQQYSAASRSSNAAQLEPIQCLEGRALTGCTQRSQRHERGCGQPRYYILSQCAALARARACTNRVPRIRARFNARTMSQLAYTILQNCCRTVSSHIEPLKQYSSSLGKADCSHISNVTGSRVLGIATSCQVNTVLKFLSFKNCFKT